MAKDRGGAEEGREERGVREAEREWEGWHSPWEGTKERCVSVRDDLVIDKRAQLMRLACGFCWEIRLISQSTSYCIAPISSLLVFLPESLSGFFVKQLVM